MPLEIKVSKKLPEFTLDVAFTAGDRPLAILGPSGAGKSMLLRCIAGLERPNQGRIVLNGRTLFDAERRIQLPARHRRVAILFQHYALFPNKTLGENVAFGLSNLSFAERSGRVADFLERTHIADLGNRYPREVSGGEQQRAALARALAIDPEALLLDEPLSALDTHLRSRMEAQLQETFSAYRRPVLLVTHNIEEAYRLGDQLLILSRGRIAAFGPKDEIFASPPTLEVAQLTGCKNFSRVSSVSGHSVDALEWNCTLRVRDVPDRAPARVGIRAHHIEFTEAPPNGAQQENVFPCWLASSSETPFRVTLYLSLHRPPGKLGQSFLQAEITKEKWRLFRDKPFPWHVRLPADGLFLMPE